METAFGPKENNPQDALGFYVAANDRELVRQITELFGRRGYVGVADGYGRMRYLVDGRDGPVTASSRILGTADEVIRRKTDHDERLLPYEAAAITSVLDESLIQPSLKGYRFLRYILSLAYRDDSLLRPITKTLYPAVAERFHTKIEHVERDVRYAIRTSGFRPAGVSSSTAICLLHDRIQVLAEAMFQRDKETQRGKHPVS
jgi:hypothetical protein